jgi:hypothetical protein
LGRTAPLSRGESARFRERDAEGKAQGALTMVATAWVSGVARLVLGLLRLRTRVSLPSAWVSPKMVTATVFWVWPGVKVRVPEVAA